MKKLNLLYFFVLSCFLFTSCTDLGEDIYSKIPRDRYYETKKAIDAAVVRPYEFGYNCAWAGDRWILQELTADHFVWTQKGKHGWDDGNWVRLHTHNWTDRQTQIYNSWKEPYQGIGYINQIFMDFDEMNLSHLMTQQEKEAYILELRALRAWYYTFLIDFFRHVPIPKDTKTMVAQSTPQEVFKYMEVELLDILPKITSTPAIGRMGKAAVATTLVRIYLNAEAWTGTARYTDCETMAQRIINGEFGTYTLDTDYRGPFQSMIGKQSRENIFEWPHAKNIADAGWLYDAFHHYKAQYILGTDSRGTWNGIHMTPSRDLDGNLYTHKLGSPYEKYTDGDYRKQNYEVINAMGETKGFFLVGKQYEFDHAAGFGYTPIVVKGSEEYKDKDLVFVDQVGRFSEKGKVDGRWNEGSRVTTGEENSGVRLMKFGPFSNTGGKYFATSTPEMRLAEVYYALAECKYRSGNKTDAAKLLDAVRKRYYPAAIWASYSYEANPILLTDDEFVDELGREFLGEHRRRSDLIRWGRFGEAWWDKPQDKTDRDYTVFPIPLNVLDANSLLKQTTRGW